MCVVCVWCVKCVLCVCVVCHEEDYLPGPQPEGANNLSVSDVMTTHILGFMMMIY